MNSSVLIVEDEASSRLLMREALEAQSYEVHEAANGQLGLQEAALLHPGLVVLDLSLPDLDGLEVLRSLREWSIVPVLALCVRPGDAEKVTVLDAGADDYIEKPFDLKTFAARARAAESRARRVDENVIFTRGDLVVDLAARRVTRGGVELKLPATEFELIRVFVRNAGRIITHRRLVREVWGPTGSLQRQYLGVYITHLRAKIEADPGAPDLIRTESGIGYRFAADG